MMRATEFWAIWRQGETIEKRVAVVQVGGDEAVYKDRGGVGVREGANLVDVT